MTSQPALTPTISRPLTTLNSIVPYHAAAMRTCTIGEEDKPLHQYGDQPPTVKCTHEAVYTCSACTEQYVQMRLGFDLPTFYCLECGSPLAYEDLRRTLSPTLFSMFVTADRKYKLARADQAPGMTISLQKPLATLFPHSPIAFGPITALARSTPIRQRRS